MKRRAFINLSVVTAGTGAVIGLNACSTKASDSKDPANILAALQPMTKDIQPITSEERGARIKKAQQLLTENNMKALILDAGTAMVYYTGIRWGRSERTMVAVIPAAGEVFYICPGFEENRLRELIKIGKQVYAWQEDESPYQLIVQSLQAVGITGGALAVEESIRFFIMDGVRKLAPQFSFVSGDPVTIPCRLIKSPAEIALMQKATDITIAAMKIGISSLHEGMSPKEFSDIVTTAQNRFGGSSDFAMVNFAEASAFPHGSTQPQQLKKGDIVLMDCGCRVEGYSSDISRTIVFGAAPTARQQEIWNLEKAAQTAGYKAAQIGTACENVDAAARKVITDAGFGPGYQLPGLPHRTGHGIGMDGHEWGNMVKGNKLRLQAGMCFSIEPNISIVGEFGVRHEDCVYMTESGPKWFSQPAPAIDQPFV
ncbi:Xaa-Pro peptidase family protein [Sediminibacterium sp.]|uniref:M24 family metallopeptidase n=1 Tax=Sediminibacterium sp. TaxID=1917865 RepID=UPI0025DEADD2|nr:Xaa-Pro peptidase family protein [Sediminibacterium sp.]MBW0179159.1 Xaa-Pro peptidase family protein [Sediminibacterium sp.]